jgi:hypothetical protein
MDVTEITTRLYAIGAAILDKTGGTPWIAPRIQIADGVCEVRLYRAYGDGSNYNIGTTRGYTPEAALDDAFAAVFGSKW